jgi:Undecaprenyl-phosphate glucose phosphotransferase
MLSRHRQLFITGVAALDATLIYLSWMGAYALRFHALGLPTPLGVPPVTLYLWFGAVLTPVALLILRTLQVYRSARTARLSQELFTLAQGIVIVTAIAALISYFTKGELSRFTLALFAVIATLVLWTSRVAIRVALNQLRRHGMNQRRVLIVGTGDLAKRLVEKMNGHPDFGMRVVGMVAADAAADTEMVAGVPVLGTVADLPGLAERERADLVYLGLARSEFEAEHEALARLADSTAAVRLVPDLARAFTLNASVEDFDGTPVVLVTETPGQGWNAVLKRGFDLAFSALGLVLLSPLLFLLALWVRLDSPGPVFYGQERVGMNGRRFRMFKFRTMRTDAEAGGEPGWTTPGDPRRTGAGRILRPLSLDELPQLWNVFLGQMSLVGPRPERPMYVEQFRASVPRYMLRHHVKAGITGWAQVHGLRGDTPLDARIEYDLYYIRHWSLALDVKIILLTFARVFRDASAH